MLKAKSLAATETFCSAGWAKIDNSSSAGWAAYSGWQQVKGKSAYGHYTACRTRWSSELTGKGRIFPRSS